MVLGGNLDSNFGEINFLQGFELVVRKFLDMHDCLKIAVSHTQDVQ